MAHSLKGSMPGRLVWFLWACECAVVCHGCGSVWQGRLVPITAERQRVIKGAEPQSLEGPHDKGQNQFLPGTETLGKREKYWPSGSLVQIQSVPKRVSGHVFR